MRRRLIFGIALLYSAASQAPAYDLGQHEWRHRLLFLIAPQSEDAGLKMQQREIARGRDAVLDRDVLVFQLLPDQGLLEENPLPGESVRALREQLGVEAEDRLIILIGKDGVIKTRAGLDTDLRDIFLQIDAMPMRGNEIRAKKKAGIPVITP